MMPPHDPPRPVAPTALPWEGRVIRLGTRGSQLATTQSEIVAQALRNLGADVELVTIHTRGDVDRSSLASLGGVGVFAAALRMALLSGECDLAVHSFKDLPTAAVPGLTIAAVPIRVDPHDVIVCRDGLTLRTLPPGARVGTGSPRRRAAILRQRPDVDIVDIRGNVGTRLSRVVGIEGEGGDLDAVVLARAGLLRLGSPLATSPLLCAEYAPAQGALAVEIREEDEVARALVSMLDDASSRAQAFAERAVLEGLNAGCAAPVATWSRVEAERLSVGASVSSVDATRRLTDEISCEINWDASVTHRDATARECGLELASQLCARGAASITDLHASKPLRPPAPHASARSNHPCGDSEGQHHHSPNRETSDEDANLRWGDAPRVDSPTYPLVGRTAILPRPADDPLCLAIRHLGARIYPVEWTRYERLDSPEVRRFVELTLSPNLDGSPFEIWWREDSSSPSSNEVASPSQSTSELRGDDWLVWTSRRAVNAFVEVVAELVSDADLSSRVTGSDSEAARHTLERAQARGMKIAAIGPRTASALTDLGIATDLTLEGRCDGATLANTLDRASAQPGRVWIPSSALASTTSDAILTAGGWQVKRTHTYTMRPDEVSDHVRAAWSSGMVDAAVFTAGSQVRAAAEAIGQPHQSMRVVTIGEPTARVAREAGWTVHAVAPTQDVAGIVTALTGVFNSTFTDTNGKEEGESWRSIR